MFDLSTAKTRLSITGTTQDAELQVALDTALAFAEQYCDRYFMYQANETEKFVHARSNTLSLKRYPIEMINSGAGEHHYSQDSGVVYLHDNSFQHETTVDYNGGYKTLPLDLEFALWAVFDTVWGQMNNVGGTPSTGGAVKAISSAGQRVEFDTSGGSVAGVDAATGIPSMALSVLNNYVRERC